MRATEGQHGGLQGGRSGERRRQRRVDVLLRVGLIAGGAALFGHHNSVLRLFLRTALLVNRTA